MRLPLMSLMSLTCLMPLLAILALATVAPAAAQDTATSRCQAIAEASARLACYDSVFPPKPRPASALPLAPAGVPVGPAPAASNQQFGLPAKPRAEEVQAIESAVESDFSGWGPNDKIRLQNGQVWEVVDGSSGTTTPAMRKVRITRGSLGSFFLEFEGLTKSPRVRRIK